MCPRRVELPDRRSVAWIPGLAGLILLIGSLGSCVGLDTAEASDPELRAELGIGDDVRIHRIDLSGRADRTRILPRSTEARAGDIVQFVVLDRRVHVIRFDETRMSGATVEFLRASGQDRPAPLVAQGARLVLSFEGAPSGSYPFVVEGSGSPVAGEIRVLESAR